LPHSIVDLGQKLQEMGMRDAFDPKFANFYGMSSEPLFISKAVHKAFVEVIRKRYLM